MGNRFDTMWDLHKHPEEAPHFNMIQKTDPMEGFAKGRKERVMVATEEEMISAKLPPEHRNYCAHFRIAFEQCKRKNYPFIKRACRHEFHNFANCENEDYIIRAKDFERERRLFKRKLAAEGA
ncbi:hypothetical protein LSTR_LSTR007088 [Laodelphax striatellus]|uniref:NADH dehydrogenase [ubiquinone] 1 beta subcomplex subunit 7 n=1 Tax=Laodelphax striatellus TaxID=195883 RepID=A0A482WF89_LAOST|nr:hypothetical protein LSTR_LSTR007088 [Laodelphax striatellus]